MRRAYKTELDPNNKQRGYFIQCAGAARFVYNWALADRIARYEAGDPTNLYEQKRRFNEIKRDEFPWIYEVPYTLQEQAFRNLDNAYQHFFRRVKTGEKPGFPKFKSRRNGLGSFSLRGSIYVTNEGIKLPRIGWVRLKEHSYFPTNGVKILSATVSERAGRWFASLQVEQGNCLPITGNSVIGIDVGILSLAVCSDGTIFENPKTLAQHERKLAALQRELSRRKKGSNNRRKTKAKIAKLHMKIANIREHALHQVSNYITLKARPSVIVIEDLNVSGMLSNRHLAKALSDASLSELHRQICYKAEWYGIEIVKADRWFPSSKTCSACGAIRQNLTLSDRKFVCFECGVILDRDLNAALNLAALVNRQTGGDCLWS